MHQIAATTFPYSSIRLINAENALPRDSVNKL